MTLKTPDLSKLGYRLADIRVYSGIPGGKAVELRYRNAQDRLFTLYLRHPSGPPRVDLVQRDGMRICIWQDDVLGTVMLGEMSAGEMARIASLAYSGLTL
jgi:anti-sigma factor RsiW